VYASLLAAAAPPIFSDGCLLPLSGSHDSSSTSLKATTACPVARFGGAAPSPAARSFLLSSSTVRHHLPPWRGDTPSLRE
jgi:hypothetical protein